MTPTEHLLMAAYCLAIFLSACWAAWSYARATRACRSARFWAASAAVAASDAEVSRDAAARHAVTTCDKAEDERRERQRASVMRLAGVKGDDEPGPPAAGKPNLRVYEPDPG